MKGLTVKQRAIFDYIEAFTAENGYAPSFEEIREHFGYRSLATVHEHLSTIERKGYIMRSYNEKRSIRICAPESEQRRSGICKARELALRWPTLNGELVAVLDEIAALEVA